MAEDFQGFTDDLPVALPSQDEFGRTRFAKRIAETLTRRRDHSSLVFALFAPWGDGKTSVLNFIYHFLDEDPSVIPIFFNPWRFSGEEHLLEAFFETLAYGLETKLATQVESVGGLLRDYGKLLKFIPKAPPGADAVVETLGKRLAEASIESRRSKISEILRSSEKRIIVFLDDIDRLEKQDIQDLFRLLKLVADFDNVSYVLAFDDEMVAGALGERFTSAAANFLSAGTRYLEKIVQVGLHLPAVSADALRTFCFGMVDEALSTAGIVLSQQEINEFVRSFVSGLQSRLKTPRLAKRYGNALQFVLALLRGEANPVDLMLIEGLRVFYPSLYKGVRLSKDVLTRSPGESEWDASEFILAYSPGLSKKDSASAIDLLANLFPQTARYQTNSELTKSKRVGSPEYFDRYFSYSVSATEISDMWFDSMLERATSEAPAPLVSEVLERVNKKNAGNFVFLVRSKEQKCNAHQARMLCIATMGIADLLSDNPALNPFSTPRSQASTAISQLMYKVPPEDRLAVIASFVSDSLNYPFVFDCLRALRHSKRGEEQLLTETEKQKMYTIVSDKLMPFLEAHNESVWSFASSDDAKRILALIAWGAGEETVKRYVMDWLAKRPDTIIEYLKTHLGSAWSLTNGQPIDADLERSEYNSIVSRIPGEKVAALIQERVGPIEDPKYDFFGEEVPAEFKVASQFLSIHSRVATSQN